MVLIKTYAEMTDHSLMQAGGADQGTLIIQLECKIHPMIMDSAV